MSDLTNYGENAAAEALFGTGTFYLALHTGDPVKPAHPTNFQAMATRARPTR